MTAATAAMTLFGTFNNPPLINIIRGIGLASDLQLALDAGDRNSYVTGQSWLDTSANGYDFFLGANGSVGANDPTFNGNAGTRTLTNYWLFNGSKYFTYDTTNETWMQNPHKNNATLTVAGWMWFETTGVAERITGTGGGNSSSIGIELTVQSADQLAFSVRNGTGTPAANVNGTATTTLIDGAWNFVALSVNEAGGAGASFFMRNTASETFNGTYSSPSASNATNTMQIAAGGNANPPLQNANRLAILAAWSAALNTTQLGNLFTATRGRYGV